MANTRVSKDVLDKFWTDDELDRMGFSGDPDDWTSTQYKQLQDLYFNMNPDAADPTRPAYNPAYDAATQSITPEMKQMLDAIALNTAGMDAFRKEALRQGPSRWAHLMNAQTRAEELNARDRGAKQARGQAAQARTELAMRGGSTSGARERVAKAAARNYLDMSQDIGREGAANRLNVGINDEQNRIQQLSMLPGMEVQSLQPQFQKAEMWGKGRQYDIDNAIHEADKKNAWNMDVYKEQMQKWAAERQAQATENSGKK